jgi:lipopolysaccharide transport system ATP-binding protein
LDGDIRERLADALGVSRLLGRPVRERVDFDALHNVTFEVPRGGRYGLIGRNGAGKTTLLKLIAGNFAPTTGSIEVNGSVQALMIMGQGFHPEYSGRDNILASLQYNGLTRPQYRAAIEEIIDFCELGAFIDQPFRTYSSGMQSRLMFAVATAIKPDILIVDEVLGAGDAYFIAKSRARVDRLTSDGSTLLLVSHSMAQVLELCERVVWLDAGRVRQIGNAFEVVKAYEEWMQKSIRDKVIEQRASGASKHTSSKELRSSTSDIEVAEREGFKIEASQTKAAGSEADRGPLLQVPTFRPHGSKAEIPDVGDDFSRAMAVQAPGGISRWAGEPGLRVIGVTISGPDGPTDRLTCLKPANFAIFLEAEDERSFSCRYGIIVHDLKGRTYVRIWSPIDRFRLTKGEGRRIDILLNPNQIGPGTYTLGITVLGESELELVNSAIRYDLLGRSFLFHVDLPSSLAVTEADFFHSAEWRMRNCKIAPESATQDAFTN